MKKIMKIIIAASVAVSCGRFKDKKDDDDNESLDAIGEGSDIRWDDPLTVEGVLLLDEARRSRYRFVYEKRLNLVLNHDANMKIKMGESTSSCSGGTDFSGVTFTLTSKDGLFMRSTDTIDQFIQPTAVEIFPGKIPAGVHTLSIRAYGSGACRFSTAFSFPNPDGDHDFPVSDDNSATDSDLTGTWLLSDTDRGIKVDTTWSFAANRTMTYTMLRGDVTRVQFTGKYQIDAAGSPRRIRLVVTNVAVSQFSGAPTTGDVLRCLYLPTPRGSATILYWQCAPIQDAAFPADFSSDAVEFKRTGTMPGTFPDFDVTKGGDTSLSIPDNDLDGLIYSLQFTTEGSSVVDLGVQFRINHTQGSDLRVRLVHPDGTSVTLYDREASTSSTINKSFGYGGTRLNTLDAFKGKSLNGKWKLVVSDEVLEDTGSLIYAKLTLRGKY